MKRRFFVLLPVLCLILLCFFSTAAGADALPYFTFSLEKSSVSQGDTVRLRVTANRMEDPAAGFRVRVSYDGDLLEYAGAETSSRIANGAFEVNPDGDPIYGVYVCDPSKGYAPSLSGNVIFFDFRVKNGVRGKTADFSVCIDQICNFRAEQLNLTCSGELPLRISAETSPEAVLESLEPLTGELEPEFAPDVYSYTLRVGSEVDSVEFRADASDGGTVKINRKSLGRAGTTTRITATVTARGRKAKSLYTVAVMRAAGSAASQAVSRPPSGSAVSRSQGEGKKKAGSRVPPDPGNGASWDSERTDAGVREADRTVPDFFASVPEEIRSPAQPEASERAAAVTRNLYFVGNRMPEYLIGMLACALCIVTGVALCLWLGIRPKK